MYLRRILLTILASSLASACSDAASTKPPPAPTVCNGRPELCERPYDAVTFPSTHDAYSNSQDGFLAPDQTYPMSRQLADGIRVLHLNILPNDQDDSIPSLCHSLCFLGSQRLVDGLKEIRTFVDAHPGELVTLLMESPSVSTDDVMAA